jgi:hypothetical protein
MLKNIVLKLKNFGNKKMIYLSEIDKGMEGQTNSKEETTQGIIDRMTI